MNLLETFETLGAGFDEKARRVSNVSHRKASITTEEIESGVTLERLSSIGVPIFLYRTQITIHGKIPGFDPASRPGGYCSIIANANGTLGVRYAGVDVRKKELVVEASVLGKGCFNASLNSRGLQLSAFFEEKDACIAALRSFPRDLICGDVSAGAGQYGGYYVIVNVGAIPEKNVWKLTEILWGVTGQSDLDQRAKERKAKEDLAMAEFAAKRAQRLAEQAEAVKKLAATITSAPLRALPKKPGVFLRVCFSSMHGKAVIRKYTLTKRGPALCYSSEIMGGEGSPFARKTSKRLTPDVVQILERAVQQGLVFHEQ